VLRGLLQAYATGTIKRYMWNSEFSGGRWDCLDLTHGDCVYEYIEKYADNGSILDLGCGSGNTGNELNETKYRQYMGVDISDVAIEKAKKRSEQSGRAEKNCFFRADIFSYVPTQQYELILLRDSIYYIPRQKIKALLDRYVKYLKEGGVFIVRMFDGSGKHRTIVDTIERGFKIVERHFPDQSKTVVIVFRPKMPGVSGVRGRSVNDDAEVRWGRRRRPGWSVARICVEVQRSTTAVHRAGHYICVT